MQASIWQHNSFALKGFFCVLKSGDSSRVLLPNVFNNVGSQWQKQTHEVYVIEDNSSLEFYVFSGGKEAYFDDLSIRRFNEIPKVKYDSEITEEILNLYIPVKTQQKLNDFKETAIKKGVIGSAEKQSLPAFLITNKDSIAIEIRLKGDWTDHLNNGKDSYRIKIKGNQGFMGMKSFSIQHPKTRNYMQYHL